MSDKHVYRKYGECIKEMLLATFQDKRLCLHFFLALGVLSLGIMSNIAVPLFLKKSVEAFSSQQSMTVALILISYGFMWMLSQACIHTRALLTYKVEQRITFVLGVKVLSHLYSLSHSYFLNQKPGTLTNIIRRAQQDVPSLTLGLFFYVLPTVLEFLFVILLILSLYPWIYSLLLAGTLIAFFAYTVLSMKSILHHRQKANDVDKSVEGVVTDWLSNYEAVKIFGKRDFAIRLCEKELKNREEAEVRFMTKFSLVRLGQSLILGIGFTFMTYVVGKAVLKGNLTIGDFVLFNGYILQFILPVSLLGQVIQDIKKALVDMKGVIDVLLTESEVKELSQSLSLQAHRFQIEFKNVTFKYNNRIILENISFKIEPGETILIVGPTGIGKSTLAKLLLRLYDPTEGQIFINQIDIKNLSFQSLYNIIGWVPQEGYLLNDTLQNNIQFVCPEATLNEIEVALECAGLLGFVDKLPEGLQTYVGDRGLKLSAGERQRLSLARLFLKKPKICIFDEATSFLDRNTEILIQENIKSFLPDMTKIVITHRPFMVNKANKIVTLDNEKIKKIKIQNTYCDSIATLTE